MNKNKKKNGSKKPDSIRNDPKKLKGGFQTMGIEEFYFHLSKRKMYL
jgi:hypothetical protein